MPAHNHVTWVVVADSNSCRIYDYHKKPDVLTLKKEMSHPENKLRDTDLTSDKPGRYRSGDSVHGAYTPHSDPKAVKIDDFSREIAVALDHGRGTNAYAHLILILLPHMEGLISQHMNKHVKAMVTKTIGKEVTHLDEHALLTYLQEHL